MAGAEPAAARVEWLTVAGAAASWERLGFIVADGLVPLHGTGLRVEALDGAPGLRGWSLSGVDRQVEHIDGVPTELVEPTVPVFAAHPVGAIDIDHVVIVTDSLSRTSGAVTAATGAELKRVREAGPVRQGFHRIGGLIIEVVERTGLPAGPASLWGFVVNVEDLHAAVGRIGPDLIGEAKPAVQPGRSIAVVRDTAGLGVPLALMDRPG